MTLKEAMGYRGENADTLAEKIGIRAGEVRDGWEKTACCGSRERECSSWLPHWTAGC